MIPSMRGIITVFVTVSLVAPSQAGCPMGWVKQGFKCTHLFSEPLTWKAAEQSCQSFTNEAGEAGHLLSIADVKENALLFLLGMSSEQVDRIWIGLSRHNDDDVMAWSDGLPTDFYGLVIDGLLDLSEEGDCALANVADIQSTMMSANCNKKLQYVCELSACPAGWTSYFGNCYRHFDEKKSWIEAEGHCLGYQMDDFVGQLVSIATEDFSRFLTEWQMMLTSNVDSAVKTWIGVHKTPKGGRPRGNTGKMAGCSQIEGGVVSNVNCSKVSAYVCEISTCPVGLVAFQDQCLLYVGDRHIGGDGEGGVSAGVGGQMQTAQRASRRRRRGFNFFGYSFPKKTSKTSALSSSLFMSKKKSNFKKSFSFWKPTTKTRSFVSKTKNMFKYPFFGAAFKNAGSPSATTVVQSKTTRVNNLKSIPVPPTASTIQPATQISGKSTTLKCPTDWSYFAGSCVLYSTEEKTWEEAESYCKSRDLGTEFSGYEAHLPTVENILQNSNLVNVVQKGHNEPPAWIGRKEGRLPSEWIVDEGTDFDGFFNREGDKEGDCVYVNYQEKYKWGHKSCSTKLAFFCKVKKTDKYTKLIVPVEMSSIQVVRPKVLKRPVPSSSSSSSSANGLKKYCFPTWKRRGDFCYYVFTEERAWEAAKDQCKEYIYGNDEVNEKANLVSVTSSEENDFLVSESSSTLPFWIGRDGTKWLDGTSVSYSASSITNQADDPASPPASSSRSCYYSLNKQWGQKECSQKLPFICKMPAAVVAHFVRKK